MATTNIQTFSGDVEVTNDILMNNEVFIKANDGNGKVGIGPSAGATAQGSYATAVGRQAGETSQGSSAVAVGNGAGYSAQGNTAVAVGVLAGRYNQGSNTTAVGNQAGETSQGNFAVAVGNSAGETSQGASAVAVGRNAGQTSQGASATAVGSFAGQTSQGTNAVAVGRVAGQTSQGASAVAVGEVAGYTSQGTLCVAVGPTTAQENQGDYATAVGPLTGRYNQGTNAVAVGREAGLTYQGTQATAVGYIAGKTSQGNSAVAVGPLAGSNNQGTAAVAVGVNAGNNNQGNSAVAVGNLAGQTSQGGNTAALGYAAGRTSQGGYATALGAAAGQTSQGASATAVGYAAGFTNQGNFATAVGREAGRTSQSTLAVAVGYNAGESSQGNSATAVGYAAGRYNQGNRTTALGEIAGETSQGEYAVAVGLAAGRYNQGTNAVAVGRDAGNTNQHNNSIVLNASGSALNTAQASSFYVKPVRGGNFAASALAYTSAGEIVEETNVYFDSSGDVGIGTANPKAQLHISSGTSGDCVLRLQADTDNNNEFDNPRIEFISDGSLNTAIIGAGQMPFDNTNNYNALVLGAVQMKFYTGVQDFTDETGMLERMTIKSDGKVGIGTTSPGAPLAVVSTRNADTWAADKSQLDVLNDNGAGSTYGMSFAVSQSRGDGIIQTFNRNSGAATYDLLLQPNAGYVGIGTTNPGCRLHIATGTGYAQGSNLRTFFYAGATGIIKDTLPSSTVSTWCDGWIGSGIGFIATNSTTFSDERLKKNIIDADDGECLDTLRQLKPKKYQYKDYIKRGETPVWGFIAQEVEQILPYSTHRFKEFIPNIYELANVSQSNVITFTNFNTSNLESNATTIRIMTKEDNEERVTIAEVIDEHTIRVEEDLSEWAGSLDETGNVVAGNQLFIYGQQAEDVRGLKKDAIWTVATSALQEVDRQLQAEKAKVATLETQLASVLTRLDALESA